MPLGLVAAVYAVSIPLSLWVYSGDDWSSLLLQKAAQGRRELRPLFRFVDRVVAAILSPFTLLITPFVVPWVVLQTLIEQRSSKRPPLCFTPVLHGMTPAHVGEQFASWEEELAESKPMILGDFFFRPKTVDKQVRYLLLDGGRETVEAFWLRDHFELTCTTPFKDGSFVSTHLVDEAVLRDLGDQAQRRTASRRQAVLTGLSAGEVLERHRQACRRWSRERRTGVRRFTADNYRELLCENEANAAEAS